MSDDLTDICKALDGGILSTETAVELNPLVKNVAREIERLKAEQEERLQQQQNIFGDQGNVGPQSFDDGNDDEDVTEEVDGEEQQKADKTDGEEKQKSDKK